MQFSAIVNRFIVKTYLNSAFTNDLKTKENFSKNVHSCRLSLFKLFVVNYKQKYVHKLLVNRLFNPAKEKCG